MRKFFVKAVSLFAACAIVVTGSGLSTLQAKAGTSTDKVKVGKTSSLGGLSWYLDNYYQNADGTTSADTVSLFAESITISENIAIANVNDKLNIRKGPSTGDEIVGYLPRHAYCYIIENDGTWAKVKSGGITGYVAVEYLYLGEEGVKKAKEVGVLTADVQAGKVNLRSEPSTASDDNIIAVATRGMELEVLEENVLSKNEEEAAIWAMVRYEDTTAYIAKQFVSISYKWLSAKEVPKQIVTVDSPAVPAGSSAGAKVIVSGEVSSVRKKIAEVAQNYVGLHYVYGGMSLSGGADCSGFCLAVYSACGVNWNSMGIPRSSSQIASSSRGKSVSLSEIKPGDIVCYGNGGRVNHVALYIGGGKVANMSSVGMKMRIDSVDYRPIYKIKNFLG